MAGRYALAEWYLPAIILLIMWELLQKMGDMVDFYLLHHYLVEEEPRRIAYAVMP